MNPSNDRQAGYALLQTAVGVPLRVTREEVTEAPDSADFAVTLDLAIEPDTDDEDFVLEDVVSRSALGILFTLAMLSFHDARPRGVSDIDYVLNDKPSVGDFITHLQYEEGNLRFYADYLRGRRMKTDIVFRADGTLRLRTLGRGKSALRWLDQLRGQKLMAVVGA